MSDATHTAEPTLRGSGYRRVWIDVSVEVDASVEEVHAWIADLTAWPTRFPGFRRVRILSRRPVRAGTYFTMVISLGALPWLWLPNRVSIFSPHHVRWGGGVPGTRIGHGFVLTPTASGRTELRHYEYATNVLALLCRPFERAIYHHDRAWSDAIRTHFATQPGRSAATGSRGDQLSSAD